jgi:hypothetical protein
VILPGLLDVFLLLVQPAVASVGQQGLAEHPPDHGRHLEDSFQILAESVDTGEQHALDRGGDVQSRERARQAVPGGLLHQVAALQEGEGQLFGCTVRPTLGPPPLRFTGT